MAQELRVFMEFKLKNMSNVIATAVSHPPEVKLGKDRTKPRLSLISARELYETEFPAIKYVLPGYICDGLTLFAGTPKLGKSWFCLDLAMAVADGGVCLGNLKCDQGDVLYLALEDNGRRLKSRMRRLRTAAPGRDRLDFATECPRGNEGVSAIRSWIHEHPSARLVVIDVLAGFRMPGKSSTKSQYEADYEALKGLQQLAMATNVAIVVVTHTRKSAEHVDPFEKVSGTLGLCGAADTTMILDRDANGCTLYCRGRDIEEIETAVSFDGVACRWRAEGNAREVRRTKERKAIRRVLSDATEPMKPADIAAEAGMKRGNADRLLGKMATAGEVVKIGRGLYADPDRTAVFTHGMNGKNGKNTDSTYGGPVGSA